MKMSIMRTFRITIRRPRLWDYLASCKRKVRYGHSHTAENAVRSMAKKGSNGLSKYQCKFCGGWHIGH
jgi:hypothetical protein